MVVVVVVGPMMMMMIVGTVAAVAVEAKMNEQTNDSIPVAAPAGNQNQTYTRAHRGFNGV